MRLASFLVASQGLLVVVVFSLHHYDLSVAAVVTLACLTILFWVFTALFDLDPVEMLVTFRVLSIFACALIFQSLVLVGLRFLIFATFGTSL